MPKILDRLVKQLIANWVPKNAAYPIAVKKMQDSWNIEKWSLKATKKWEKRGKMTPAQRAIDRAAKKWWESKKVYKYNKKNNTAVKGKINKNVKKRA